MSGDLQAQFDVKQLHDYSNRIHTLRFDDSDIGRHSISSRYAICHADWAYRTHITVCFFNMKMMLLYECRKQTGRSKHQCKAVVNNGFAQLCSLSAGEPTEINPLCKGITFRNTWILDPEAPWFVGSIGVLAGFLIGMIAMILLYKLCLKKKGFRIPFTKKTDTKKSTENQKKKRIGQALNLTKNTKNSKDSKASQDSKDSKDSKDLKNSKDSNDTKNSKDTKTLKDPKKGKESKESKTSTGSSDSKDSKKPEPSKTVFGYKPQKSDEKASKDKTMKSQKKSKKKGKPSKEMKPSKSKPSQESTPIKSSPTPPPASKNSKEAVKGASKLPSRDAKPVKSSPTNTAKGSKEPVTPTKNKKPSRESAPGTSSPPSPSSPNGSKEAAKKK